MSELTSDDGAWLHLINGSGETAALLEFRCTSGFVTISAGPRLLATVPAEELGQWLASGQDPLTTGALVWTLEGHRVGISIGMRPPLLVPEIFILDLMDGIQAARPGGCSRSRIRR